MLPEAISTRRPLRVITDLRDDDTVFPIDRIPDPRNTSRHVPLPTALRNAKSGKRGVQLPVLRISRQLCTTQRHYRIWLAEVTAAENSIGNQSLQVRTLSRAHAAAALSAVGI
jgi:hypothetical protein